MGIFCVAINIFHICLGYYEHRKLWHKICDSNISSSIIMKQHSQYCINFLGRRDRYSSLNHLKVDIKYIIILIWVTYFKGVVHFIIINWDNWSGIWIWKRVTVRFRRIIWSANLDNSIINGGVVDYFQSYPKPHNWFLRRGPGF